MTRRLLAAIVGVAALGAAHTASADPSGLANCLGDPGAVAWLGNGTLALGISERGQLVSVRWPGPGGPDQLSYAAASFGADKDVPHRGGATWAISAGGEPTWLAWEPWKWSVPLQDADRTMLEMQGRCESLGLTARQRFTMPVDRPIIIVQLEVEGLSQPPSFYWYADLSPCCRRPAQLAAAEILFAALRDFACFSEDGGKTIYHFRPDALERKDRDYAAALLRGEVPPGRRRGWAQFEKGAWLAYAALGPVRSFECGNERGPSSAFEQVRGGLLANQAAAVGACDSAFAMEPVASGNGFSATLVLAFGNTRDEASKLIGEARSFTFERVAAEARDAAIASLNLPPLTCLDVETERVCRRAARTLFHCVDSGSGAIILSPIGDGLSALDWPRDGAWATLALDMLGRRDLAEAHTFYYCRAVRDDRRASAPSGSLPAALYSDGREALPDSVLDAGAAAWTLGSIWRHASFLEHDARNEYLGKTWDSVRRMGDFLAAWTDARTHEPFPYFDIHVLRDRNTEEGLLEIYMGVDAALRVAAELGHDAPDPWARRKQELDIQLRFKCIDAQGLWRAEAVLPYWQQEVARAGLPSWNAVLDRRIAAFEAQPDADPDGAVCDAALAGLGTGPSSERVRSLLGRLGLRVGEADALRSAQLLIAAAAIYPSK